MRAELGVFGGSGFYSYLDDAEEVVLDTPWGAPSAPLTVGRVGDHSVAFLPRHGRHHELLPSQIPFRANLWAMRELGVRRLFGPCAAGSLQRQVEPGDLVVCDQLVDRTVGREETYFEGPGVVHVAFADPYCPELRAVMVDAARAHTDRVHDHGTVVVIQGPRFSTRAESRWYASQGFEIISMTQHPEAYLARELGICYSTLALITDHDAGAEGLHGVPAVTQEQVFSMFEANLALVRQIVTTALESTPLDRTCSCADATGGKVPVPPGAK